MMAKMPVAGVIWQTVHYLIGFQRLGYDVYYVEAHATTPTMFLDSSDHDGSDGVAALMGTTVTSMGKSSDRRWVSGFGRRPPE